MNHPQENLISAEMEQRILGVMLVDPSTAPIVRQIVSDGDFFYERNATIYRMMCELSNRSALDYAMLVQSLKDANKLDFVGGENYVVALARNTLTISNVAHYAKVVFELSGKRKIFKVAESIATHAVNPDLSYEDAFTQSETDLLKVSPIRAETIASADAAISDVMLSINQRINDPTDVPGLRTYLTDLDTRTGGLRTGLYVIAGQSSMGKTALALSMFLKMAQHRTPCGFVTLEMTRTQLTQRLIAMQAKVKTRVLETGLVDNKPMGAALEKHIQDTALKMSVLPFHIIGASGRSSATIRAMIIDAVKRYDIKVFFVDYIQLMTDESDNDVKSLDIASRNLKETADELNIPVIVLSQLNRSIEKRDTHVPTLGDIRGSGRVSENADVVWGLNNEDWYHRFDIRWTRKNELGVFVVKDRLGDSAGKAATLRFIPEFALCENATKGE